MEIKRDGCQHYIGDFEVAVIWGEISLLKKVCVLYKRNQTHKSTKSRFLYTDQVF